MRYWAVGNVRTGIVVSTWANPMDAYNDMGERDEKWADIEPPDRSPLVIWEVQEDGAA